LDVLMTVHPLCHLLDCAPLIRANAVAVQVEEDAVANSLAQLFLRPRSCRTEVALRGAGSGPCRRATVCVGALARGGSTGGKKQRCCCNRQKLELHSWGPLMISPNASEETGFTSLDALPRAAL